MIQRTHFRTIWIAAAFLAALIYSGCAPAEQTIEPEDTTVLHEDALVWDCHNDLVYRVLYENLDIGNRLPAGQVDIPRLKEGRVDVQVMALYVENFLYPDKCAWQTLALIDAMKGAIESHADSLELARTGADIERIVASGKIAIPLAIEGGHAIESSLDLLRRYHDLGVSSMTLTHGISHDWADSSSDEPRWNGLTDFGRDVVREMNRLKMVIDISHVSDKTFYDVIETTTAPVIASHSCCRALCSHPRNMTDDMLRALAQNGGVVGINFVLFYLTEDYLQARLELQAITEPIRAREPEIEDLELRIALSHLSIERDWPLEGRPTLEDILDHIDHAVEVAGVDHVGIGADMVARMPTPVGMRGAHDYPALTAGLKRRGYSDADIRKIMGENMLRIWKAVTD